MITYNDKNFKLRAKMIQKRFANLLNPLTYEYLNDIEIKPHYCPDQRTYVFEDDKESYIDPIIIPDEQMSLFFKGTYFNFRPRAQEQAQ